MERATEILEQNYGNSEFGIDELQKENEHRKHITSYVVLGAVVVALLLALLVWWLMRRRMRVREEALLATINALRNEKPESNPSTVTELTEQDEQLLQQVVASVKKGMENSNVNIETIASEVCLSRSQLNRRIKSITGVTTQQYVNRVRLEQARELLANESLQVSEVAYHCGFDDVASFSRAFRRTFGVSPSQHRNSSK